MCKACSNLFQPFSSFGLATFSFLRMVSTTSFKSIVIMPIYVRILDMSLHVTNFNLPLYILRVWIPIRRCVLDTTLCDNVCQWLAAGRWFSSGTPIPPNKTDRHDITEILLEVALNTITLPPNSIPGHISLAPIPHPVSDISCMSGIFLFDPDWLCEKKYQFSYTEQYQLHVGTLAEIKLWEQYTQMMILATKFKTLSLSLPRYIHLFTLSLYLSSFFSLFRSLLFYVHISGQGLHTPYLNLKLNWHLNLLEMCIIDSHLKFNWAHKFNWRLCKHNPTGLWICHFEIPPFSLINDFSTILELFPLTLSRK